jgi:hypothetical protein
MVDPASVRRLALALPQVEGGDPDPSMAFSVGGKGMAWPYLARSSPKGRREVVPGVLAVRCRPERKELLLEAAPDTFFQDDHYRSFPAILVRLDQVSEAELADLLRDAWRLQAPKALVRRFDADG